MGRSYRAALAAVLLLAAACSGEAELIDPSTPPQSTSPTPPGSTVSTAVSTTAVAPVSWTPAWRLTIDDASSMNVTVGPDGQVMLGWIIPGAVFVAPLGAATGALGDSVAVNGGIDPFAHPIERPALSIDATGSVDVAFTALQSTGGSVFLARWNDGDITEPVAISGEAEPETNLVHLTRDPQDRLVAAWLEDLTLSVAAGAGTGAIVETESVDDLTCDCCNPVPLFVGDELVVAYRDLVRTDDAPYRDIAVLRSQDGGVTFGEHVTIADDHWAIAGCPFTGPSIVASGGAVVVAWMDARQSVHPDQDGSTIWVDRSLDDGRTFGVDVPLTTDGIHRWPVMAVDAVGTIHLVWQTQGTDGGLHYTRSTDHGQTFETPVMLIDAADGPPQAPSITVASDLLVVTWVAARTGHVAAWPLATPGN